MHVVHGVTVLGVAKDQL